MAHDASLSYIYIFIYISHSMKKKLFWNTILLNKNYKRIIIIFTILDYYLKVQESHFFQAI